ncbi:MAG: flippase [Anaerolineae bacterium]|nr:flippase [Anaerolineae bacterium]
MGEQPHWPADQPNSEPMLEQTHHTVARVGKNVVAQIVALASTTVSKLLITIIVGRLFGPQKVGEFAFVLSLSLMFTFLATLGLPAAIIREVATHRDQAHHYAEKAMTIVLVAGVATIPLMAITAVLLGRPSSTCIAVALAGVALVFDGMAQIACGVFNGFERMEMVSIVMIVQELTFLIVGAIVLFFRLPFMWVFVVYVPSRLAGLLVAMPLYRRLIGRSLRPGRLVSGPSAGISTRELLRLTTPYAVNMALGPIYLRIDVVMLTSYHGTVASGLYEAATGIFYRFNVFARTINNALMPLMAREFESQAERIITYINGAIKYQVVVGIPLSVLCVGLADPLVNMLYGAEFAFSAPVFRMLATVTTLRFVNNTLATALTASGYQPERSVAVALSSVFNVVVNLFVLPVYSFVGAAVTTIFTELFFFGVLYLYLVRKVQTEAPAKSRSYPVHFQLLLKPAVAGAAMALILWLLRAWSMLPLFLVGSAIYLIVLFAVGTFSRQEVNVVLQILRRGLAIFQRQARRMGG